MENQWLVHAGWRTREVAALTPLMSPERSEPPRSVNHIALFVKSNQRVMDPLPTDSVAKCQAVTPLRASIIDSVGRSLWGPRIAVWSMFSRGFYHRWIEDQPVTCEQPVDHGGWSLWLRWNSEVNDAYHHAWLIIGCRSGGRQWIRWCPSDVD